LIQKDAHKKLRRLITGLHRPLGLQEFEASRFLVSRHTKVVRKVSALPSKLGSWVFVSVSYGMYLVSPFWRLPRVRNIFVRCVEVLCLRQFLFLFPRNYGTWSGFTSHEFSVKIIQHYTFNVVSSVCV